MFTTKTVLSQMQSLISRHDFKKAVSEYNGDKGTRVFSTKNLLSVMVYVHMASKRSLRDIIDSLESKENFLYHIGIKSVSRNNLSHALKHRSHKIFEKTFYSLLGKLQNERGMTNDKRFKFKMPIKSIDSTTISLCLSLFDWAKFRKKKGGIKLHVVFDNKEQLPEFINFSNASRHDIKAADSFPLKENSIYTFDRGYICFDFLSKVNRNKAFFVTRTKSNTSFKIIERKAKSQEDIKADWIVMFDSFKSKNYPDKLRVVRYYDKEKKTTYEYMTNNFNLSAKTIADIYKARWDIELFFKWIKQNLKIKTFIGTSENAVRIQIWAAMISLLLSEYLRFKTKSHLSILRAFRILSENIINNVDAYNLLIKKIKPPARSNKDSSNQLLLDF